MQKINSQLEQAIQLSKKGWSIIPLHGIENGICTCSKKDRCTSPGKHPRVSSWLEFQKRQASLKEIKNWWIKWPNSNIGVVTGKISGLVIADFDGEEGMKSSKKLLFEGKLKQSLIAVTGNGLHFYYGYSGKHSIKNSVSLHAKKMD